MNTQDKHFGDYTDAELASMSVNELVAIIKQSQMNDNFIIMTDSYKMTHHMLLPEKIEEINSYMESRGGEMPYSVFVLLQYYLKKYFCGVRITPDKIEEARQANIKHFGFDCFNDTMWKYIWEKHGGKLPLHITAVPEGTPVKTKNVMMNIVNTDSHTDKICAPLTNISETLLMKLWASNTVAAYARLTRALLTKFHALTSDAPQWLVDFMHHDFGYRGVSSEESARILGSAGLSIGFKGTDTMGALKLCKDYYNEEMAGFSVIASEHSCMCSYGGREMEAEAYKEIIQRVKRLCADVNPASGVIILSLVSDTYNIYNVVYKILPELKDEFIGWTNNHGIPIKIVVRPDSGEAENVLFGYDFQALANSTTLHDTFTTIVNNVANDMNIDLGLATQIVSKGIVQILFDQFGYTTNSKGYKVFHPQIGLLQGDGVEYKVILKLLKIMVSKKIETMNIVFGSGGKYLQAHDRDEQKYAIKASHSIIDGVNLEIEKNPITDIGKKSKKGYLKLVKTGPTWNDYITMESCMPGFAEAKDELVPVFKNGELLVDYNLSDLRKNAELTQYDLDIINID